MNDTSQETVSDAPLQELLALDMEYRLTVAMCLSNGDENCANYLIRRRDALLPEILRTAHEQGVDPVDHFAAFANKVHVKLCESCHCGAPVIYGFDDDLTHTRGMCKDCDAVRCDAFPGACGR